MKSRFIFLLTVFLCVATLAFSQEVYNTTGTASYYGEELNGRLTASGELFNMNDFTAAHKTLPFNTLVRITNLANGKSVTVRINDRGPYAQNREIDVSKAAASALGMLETGLAQVSLQVVHSVQSEQEQIEETPFTRPVYTAPAPTAEQYSPNVRYDIQLGAYTELRNAEVMATRLYDAGFTGIVYQKEGSLIRVVLKDLSSQEVQTTTAKLRQSGFTEYIVKRRTLN